MSGSRWLAGGIAAFASLVLHLVLLESVLWAEGGANVRVQSKEGLGANAIAADTEASATLILIEDPDASVASEERREPLASHGPVLQSLRLTIVSPEPKLDLGVDEVSSAAQGAPELEDPASDREARAALFGRYVGQIQARIERAWMKPRTPIGAEQFECRVQVMQNSRGEVLELTLEHCNGDTRWQVSLVNAIERASPLPAPPDPKVFASALQLSFQSAGYTAESSEDGFEPVVSARN